MATRVATVMIKFTILLRRNPAMSHDEFVTYHKERHAPLFCALPEVREHVRRYVQSHTVLATIPGLPPMTFDGITELWFDDVAGLAAVFTAENYSRRSGRTRRGSSTCTRASSSCRRKRPSSPEGIGVRG